MAAGVLRPCGAGIFGAGAEDALHVTDDLDGEGRGDGGVRGAGGDPAPEVCREIFQEAGTADFCDLGRDAYDAGGYVDVAPEERGLIVRAQLAGANAGEEEQGGGGAEAGGEARHDAGGFGGGEDVDTVLGRGEVELQSLRGVACDEGRVLASRPPEESAQGAEAGVYRAGGVREGLEVLLEGGAVEIVERAAGECVGADKQMGLVVLVGARPDFAPETRAEEIVHRAGKISLLRAGVSETERQASGRFERDTGPVEDLQGRAGVVALVAGEAPVFAFHRSDSESVALPEKRGKMGRNRG